MKASPWEKEDAMHEGIPILNFLVPKAFVHENGKLTGMTFEKVKAVYDEKGRRSLVPTGEPDEFFECDDVLVAVGQENAFPWIERDCGIEFDKWGMPVLNKDTLQSTVPKVFFGGDAAFGPKNIIWAVAHGHEAAVSIDRLLHGEDVAERPPPMVNLVSQKMGIHEWSYDNDISTDKRFKVPWAKAEQALASIKIEVELGFDVATAVKEAARCLNCDVQTVFTESAVHRVRRLRRHLPDGLHHLHRERRGSRPAPAAEGAGPEQVAGALRLGRAQDRAGDGQGRGRLPALRALRRALPHRGLGHAEVPVEHDTGGARLPGPAPAGTGGRMKRIEAVNDFVIKFANVNGSGSASANELFAKAIMRMGVPVSPRNIFPSNIQGLPTWYEVRVSEQGCAGRRGGVDLMVAMNPQTWDADVAEIEPGGYLFYDCTRPLPPSKFRDDIHVIGMPLTEICNATYTDPRQRQLFKNIIYVGALSALLDMDAQRDREADRRAVQGQGEAARPQRAGAAAGPRLRARAPAVPAGHHGAPLPTRSATGSSSKATAPRRSARLRRRHGLRLVPDHAVVVARRGLPAVLRQAAASTRRPASHNYAIVQAEDELASIGMVDRRRLERRARLHRHLRARHLADDRSSSASPTSPRSR